MSDLLLNILWFHQRANQIIFYSSQAANVLSRFLNEDARPPLIASIKSSPSSNSLTIHFPSFLTFEEWPSFQKFFLWNLRFFQIECLLLTHQVYLLKHLKCLWHIFTEEWRYSISHSVCFNVYVNRGLVAIDFFIADFILKIQHFGKKLLIE